MMHRKMAESFYMQPVLLNVELKTKREKSQKSSSDDPRTIPTRPKYILLECAAPAPAQEE